jgi:hypothetical protein
MVKVRGLDRKRKKPTKTFSRRASTGFEQAPMKTFLHLSEYVRTEIDRKQVVQKIKAYIRDRYKGQERTLMLSAPDWAYATATPLATSLHWIQSGNEVPENWDHDKVVRLAMDYIREQAEKKLEDGDSDHPKVKTNTRSPMEIVKDRTEDFIGEVESVLDDFHKGVHLDIENYSVYNELMKIDAAYNIAKGVHDFYKPLEDELRELVEKKTADLVEGYGHLKVARRKEYLKLVETIVADAQRYMDSKKAVRKPRRKVSKSADKQVAKVQYQKNSDEYKLTSIHPTQIVGARRVYLFNTKERFVVELVCRTREGFEVSGTTIQGIDEDLSRTVRLRKPEDFLPIVQSKSPTQINKEWNKLTTKPQKTTGRLNKYTVILKALDK